MEFLDRQDEQRLLRDHLGRDGGALFVLYGRRRVGKTALLAHTLSGAPRAAFHVATRSTPTEELRRLSSTLAREWDVPLLEAQPLASAEALLAFLESVREPSTLVIDELPYLVESIPDLPGLLQRSWDHRLRHGPLKLVFCGSSVGMMEETFLARGSPLFGRRTGQLRLGPLAPQHLEAAFPGGLAACVELGALFGGVPGYLARLDPAASLADNLRTRVLTPGEPLYEEVPFLLREELREPRVYFAVLAAVAAGARKFGELSSKVGLDRANLTRYLTVLADLGLLEREVPVTEPQPDKSRKGLYRIADPFVATWFAFVHPNRDRLERGQVSEVLRDVVLPRLPLHLSVAAEPVVQRLARDGAFGELVPFEVAFAGRHVSVTAELDLVLLDAARGRALVGELKWSRSPIAPSLIDDLRRRVEGEPAFRGVEVTYALFSRSGFSSRPRRRDDERYVDVGSGRAPG